MGCARFVCRGWEGSLLSFSPWMRILRLLLSGGSAVAVFFHVMQWGGFNGSKHDSQGHVLDFVQPALIGFGSRSPRSGCLLYCWSYCCCVNFGQN